METNSSGDTSTKPKEFEKFRIRQYVAEVRGKDWKKCFPFNVSRDSSELDHLAQRLFDSLTLEDNDALVNTPENIEAPNFGNPEVQAAVSETHTGATSPRKLLNSEQMTSVVIANDAPINMIGDDSPNAVSDTPLELASCKVTHAHSQNEKIILRPTVAADNDKQEDTVVVDDSLKGIDGGASTSSSSKLKDDVQYQNENTISEEIIAAGNDDDGAYTISDEERNLAGEKPKKFRLLSDILKDRADAGSDFPSESEDDSDDFTLDTSVRKKKGVVLSKKKRGSRRFPEDSKPSSSKLKDGVQYQNEINTISEDTIAAGNDDDDDDGAYTISDEERNLAGEKPKKFRLLSDILKDLADAESDFSSESEDDSDDFTLDTFVTKKKGVVLSKKKRGSRKCPERSCNRAKRIKPMASDSSRKDPKLVSKRPLRKTRSDKVDLEVMNKHKVSSAETIVHDSASGSQKVAPSSLGGGENRSGTRKLFPFFSLGGGSCDAASAGSDFSSETEDDSDDFSLDKSVRKKKGVVVSKKKRGLRKFPERSFNRPKRMKPLTSDSSRKDPEVGFKCQWRKTRTNKVDLQVMNKLKTSSAEIIVHGGASGSKKVALTSVGGGGNRSGTDQKNSLLSRGNKRNRGTIEDDSGSDVLKLVDGSKRRFTGENSSRPTQGVKGGDQIVQPNIAVLKNTETDSGYAQRIRENSPPIDNESMAAMQLLRLFNSGVTTHSSSNTATSDRALPVSNGETSCGVNGKMPSASGSIVGQSRENNMIIVAGLPQAEQIESEFSIRNAKNYMRKGKAIQK